MNTHQDLTTRAALTSSIVRTEPAASKATFPARATIADWCKLSGMGRSTTYEALGAGHLRAVKLGTRTLIDVPHGLDWLDRLPAATIRPHSAKHAQEANLQK